MEWLNEYPQIELRYLLKSIKTRLTKLYLTELSLVIEEKENEETDILGLATYSNSESTVLLVPQYLRIYGTVD